MTIEQANQYFAALPDGFASTEQLRTAFTAPVQKVQFVGVAGTAGKTVVARLLAAILHAQGIHAGLYHAGFRPLSERICIDDAPVDEGLLALTAEVLSAAEALPRDAAELAAAANCFGAAGCTLAVVELPDAGLAEALPGMPVCAVTSVGPDGVSRSVERLAALAAGVMRKGSICVTAPVQKVQFVGVAGTAGKTVTARLLAAILHAQGIHAGLYHAGCRPLSERICIDDAPVDEGLLALTADALSAAEALPQDAAELAAAANCFGAAGCTLAVVELPDAGLAEALPGMPVCAVTSVGPDGVSRSVERLAALAAGVMRKESICVTAPEQPKSVLGELIVAAGKCDCELVVPDPEDITFLEAEKFASKVDYGGYTVPLAFLGRHAAGSAAMAVELSVALCRKGFDITDDAILEGLAAVENRSSIRVVSQRPLIILDACRTPQQAAALLRVLNMAKVRHMSAIIGLAEEEGAEAFFSALETGLTPEEQKKDKSTMPGMSENPFDKVYLVTPAGGDDELTARLTEKAKYHFDAEMCTSIAEAVELAHANTRRGLLVCGGEAAALEAAELLVNS